MKKPDPNIVATVAATLLAHHQYPGETEMAGAIRTARKLISLAESLPVKPEATSPHHAPREVFGYAGDNWRKRTLERIALLFEADVPPDGKTPDGIPALRRIEGGGWASPEEFLDYHERRGLEGQDAGAIRDLIRRWKADRARVGPRSRKMRQ